MTIEQRTLNILEYPKIRQQLAEHTAFSASRELALSLLPDEEIGSVRRAQRATSAARQLFETFPDITVGGARDIRQPVRQTLRGGMLEPAVLLEVAATLEAMRQLRARLLKLPDEPYGPLLDLAYQLPDLSEIEDAIWRAVDPGGTILDSASPALGKIRSEIRIAHGRLMDRLNAILSSSQYASALQDPIITMRDGRYVIPIKATGRRTLRGIVHDQSNTGATLFVEPLQTVELSNSWRELQLAEQQEIIRILQMLSAQIGQDGTQIIEGVAALAEIDLLFAKARYSVALNAFEPQMVERGIVTSERPEDAPLYLRKARHPLLNPSTVVPTDVWLGGTFRVLLITGPNTGGKTVALKTTGLLALMAQAGLHIPAGDRSRLPIFRHIFADIGDEQSIEQSLSTFSSHMTHIIAILRALDETANDHQQRDAAALVLFDELGAGTDPTEGAALARAIIERVLESGALCIGTTHYAELKAYAHNTPNVVNGSVEFDQETLRPTYKLEIGLPGRSNALAIASRLGLETALIDRARSFLSSQEEQVEDLLASIAREREAAAEEHQRSQAMRADAEQIRGQLQEQLDQLERERDQRIHAFEQELDDELRSVRQELRRLREDTRSVSLTREWLQQAEERLKAVGESADRQRQERRRQTAPRSQPTPSAPAGSTPGANQAPRPLQPGDRVHVTSVKLDGEILSIDAQSGEAEVQVGGFRMTVDLRELRRIKGKEKDTATRIIQTASAAPRISGPARDVSMQLDMRGMRAGEIEGLLDRYLNDAYLSDLSEVRLVHGKGTGTLRKIVRDVLGMHPLVASHTGGVDGEGGDGVTVAKLHRR